MSDRVKSTLLVAAQPRLGGRLQTLLNIAQSQLGWFACVLSAAAGHAWIGVLAVAVLITLHLAIAVQPLREVSIVFAAAVIGAVTDTTLVQLGLLSFEGYSATGFTTLWMIALWMLFATTLRHSLAWLQGRLAVSALIGGAAGPLSYAAGAALGALHIDDQWYAYPAIGALWAIALPALVAIAHRPERQAALTSDHAPS